MPSKLTISLSGDAEAQVRQQSKLLGLSNAAYVSMVLAKARMHDGAMQSTVTQQQANSDKHVAVISSETEHRAAPRSNVYEPKFKPFD